MFQVLLELLLEVEVLTLPLYLLMEALQVGHSLPPPGISRDELDLLIVLLGLLDLLGQVDGLLQHLHVLVLGIGLLEELEVCGGDVLTN